MGLSDEQVAEMLAVAAAAPSEPRPKLTDADVARMLSGIPVAEGDGPGSGMAFVRGLTREGPAQIAEAAMSATEGLAAVADWMGVPGAAHMPEMSDRAAAGTRELADSVLAINEPENQKERTAEAAGAATAFGLAAAPIVLSGAGPVAAAAEVGLAGLGGAAGEELRAASERGGIGELGQSGAELGGDLLISAVAPATIVAKGPKVIDRARNIKKAYEASPEVDAIAKKMGVSVRDLLDASGEFKRKIPLDPRGEEKFVTQSSDALGQAIEKFDPETIPTTRQILNKQAGGSIASLEEGLGRTSDDFGMRVEGRRQASIQDLQERYKGLQPEAAASEATRAFDVVRDKVESNVNQLWDRVRAEEVPSVPTAEIKESALRSVQRAGEFEEDIPKEVLKVLEWPDEVSWEKYQNLRSRMLRSHRIGKRGAADTQAQHRADNMGPLIEGMNKALDDLSGKGSDEYRQALSATRKFYADFDPKSAAVRGLEDYTEGQRIVSKIKGAKDPAGEASRARRIVEQEPGGLESLQRMFMDDLVGPGRLDDVSFNRAKARLQKNENAARVVMGDAGFDSAIDILERAKISSVGRSGNAAAAVTTGSNIGPLEIALAKASDFSTPAGAASSIVMKVVKKTMNNDSTRIGILREALLDPKLAKALLDMPTERSIEAWVINWQKLVRRAEYGRNITRETAGDESP